MTSRIMIWPNPEKEQARGLLHRLLPWLSDRRVEGVIPEDLAQAVGQAAIGLSWENPKLVDVDWVMVLGGDGTLLRAAKQMTRWNKPLLGVNLGHLGFLTEVEVPELFGALPLFLSGEYVIDTRRFLTAKIYRDHRELATYEAMNDVVVAKGPFARLVHLETFVDDAYVTTYPADGLIVATPTGSTAYSLSAGGPILSPDLGVMMVTPICPHSFFDRSIVIPSGQSIRIRVRTSHSETLVTVDGQEAFGLEDGDEIVVVASDSHIGLMRHTGWNFFHVLRGWRKGH